MDKRICKPHGTRKDPLTITLSTETQAILTAASSQNSAEYLKMVMELVSRGSFNNDELLKVKNHAQNVLKRKRKETVDTSTVGVGVNFIYRGDLISNCDEVYLDIENVTQMDTHKHLPASIAVVDKHWRLLLWAIVKHSDICRYNTALTGIDQTKLDSGISYDIVKEMLKTCIKEKLVIGFATGNDLKTLNMGNTDTQTEDLHQFFRDRKNNAMCAEDLGIHFLGKNMQENPHHCCIRDARIAVLCHKKKQAFLEKYPHKIRFECEDLDNYRDAKPSRKEDPKSIKWEGCSKGCALKEQYVKGKKKQHDDDRGIPRY